MSSGNHHALDGYCGVVGDQLVMKGPKPPQWPTLGPSNSIAEGDSRVIYDYFSDKHLENLTRDSSDSDYDGKVFTTLKTEIHWQKMSHRAGEVPRLVCAQGEFLENGFIPVYRHPSDEIVPLQPWSPLVKQIRDYVEELVQCPINHCLAQFYRDGNDYISEHSDKTLDIVRGSPIVNVSFGAQRTMRLRTKKAPGILRNHAGEMRPRITQLVPLPHGSVFIFGQESNKIWLHGINPDKRPTWERTALEQAFDGQRISLTFRWIGTFVDRPIRKIWGQGATAKTKSEANDVVNGVEEQTEKMIRAFGIENHDPAFDWEGNYGHGFDVMNYNSL